MVGLAILARYIAQPWFGVSRPYIQFFPAVALAAWFGGWQAGVISALLSAAGAALFLTPVDLFNQPLPQIISLPLFLLFAAALIWIIESLRYRARTAAVADRRSRELQAIFDAIPDAIYVGNAERFTQVNSAGLRMLGATSLDDLNERQEELRAQLALRSIKTGARLTSSERPFSRALNGEVVAEELRARSRDTGEDIFIRSTAAPIIDDGRVTGAVVVNADVTERHRAAERLAEANAAMSQVSKRLDEVVANVPGIVWEAWGDPDTAAHRIDFVNDYIESMLGYEKSVWTSVPNFWPSIVHPDDRDSAMRDAASGFARGTGGRSEFRFLHRDGHVVWVESHSRAVFDAAGRPIGMRGVTLDITDRKALEEERRNLERREREALTTAVEANRLKDDFLATLSHELRTPLNAILGYARMLRSGIVGPQRHARALEIVERNATALTQMVGDVLDVSRIVAGKIRLNVQPVDLSKIADEAIGSVRPAADAKGVRLQPVIDPQAGPISGDSDRLRQVLWNLLSNAVRFTPRGGRVQFVLQSVNSHVEIVVTDTGVGITPEFLPHVFERFRQADSRFSREHSGLGLGLAISHELVEMHGGTIEAFSDGPGKGATFRVTLPVLALQTPLSPERRQTRPEPVLPPRVPSALTGLRILVVDDDSDARELLQDVLEQAGAVVTTAEGGPAALRMMGESIPDVLLSDLGMPGMDGFDLLAAVKASPAEAVRGIPAIALTAYARSDDRTRSLTSGFLMHLSKPIDPGELVAAVASLGRRAASERHLGSGSGFASPT
jgi:PAS domain S-box-containing protein